MLNFHFWTRQCLIKPSELTHLRRMPSCSVSGAVLSRRGVALSEVAEERISLKPFNEKTQRIDTKNNSTIVSDKREKSTHTAALLLPISTLPLFLLTSHLFLKWIKHSMKENKTGCSRLFVRFWKHQPMQKRGSVSVTCSCWFLIFSLEVFDTSLPPFTSSYYKILLQTWQRLTLERSWPPFRVSCAGE